MNKYNRLRMLLITRLAYLDGKIEETRLDRPHKHLLYQAQRREVLATMAAMSRLDGKVVPIRCKKPYLKIV